MKYLLLICTDEAAEATNATPDRTAEYMKWAEEAATRGVLVGGERLRPTTDATTVRVRNGELLVADGPFAETKEQIGGYFVIDVPNIDDAVKAASMLPGSQDGTIEVRPIWEM
ncbi:MAG TPA: YciI family protein [Acidimicrobiales bacterium]|nr:YciI family protein [Acidimicrobiales bacterium]